MEKYSKSGDTIFVPTGSLHRFSGGHAGEHVLVISPPQLEFYFFRVSELLIKGTVSSKMESQIGEQYGQVFLENMKY